MKKITMSKKDFVKEHQELTKILKSGDKAGLKQEYKEQKEELNKIKHNTMKKESKKEEKMESKKHEKSETPKMEKKEHKMKELSKKFYK